MKMSEIINYIILLFICMSMSAYATNSTTNSSQGYKPTAADFADIGDKQINGDAKTLDTCSALENATQKLVSDFSQQDLPIAGVNYSNWIKILQNYVESKDYRNMELSLKNTSECSESASNFVKFLNGFLENPNNASDDYINLIHYFNNLANSLYSDNSYKEAFMLHYIVGDKDESGSNQYYLAHFYANGVGTEKDLNAASIWYDVAIEKQRKTGNTYLLINTLDEAGKNAFDLSDYRMTYSYYLEAAKLGEPGDQFKTAISYTQGYGVLQDNKKAYAWVSIAILQGLPNKQIQSDAESLRDRLASALKQDKTGKDIKDAQALAKQYYQLYVLHQTPTPPKPPSFSERLSRAIQAFNS